MIENALLAYIENYIEKKNPLYTLYCPEWIRTKTSLFWKKYFNFSIVLTLHTDLIPMEKIFQELEVLFQELRLNPKIPKKISWFVLSPRGGIYLYETIATKAHKNYKKMHNRFVVINTEAASLSFGPGHTKNAGFSQVLFSLIQNSRFYRREEWLEKMFDFFRLCEHTILK